MDKKVLIFGYSGFVGPYLAKEFINNGYNVVGTDIIEPISKGDSITFFKSDLLDFNQVECLINRINPTMIINLAAISSVGLSWKMPQRTMQVNVIGTLNILEAARKLENMPKVMFVGSSEEYASSDKPLNEKSNLDSNNPYGISKLTQEKYAELYKKQFGMKIYCVRAFNHTGIGQKDTFVLPSFCKQVAEIDKTGKPGLIKVGNLEVIRDFSDVRDIVRGYRMIIENDNNEYIFNIGSGKSYSLKELLEYIISLSSNNIKIEIDSERYRPIDTPIIQSDISCIKNIIGWYPQIDIKDTLKEMFEYYKSN